MIRVGTIAIATTHAETKEILARDEDFTVALYTPKMAATVGPFLLGMQHTPSYDHDHEALQVAVPREDLPVIQSLVDDIVEDVLTIPRRMGRLDVVSDVAEGIPLRLSARYFGLTDPDGQTLVPLGRAVFRNTFYNLDDPAIAQPAVGAGQRLQAHVAGLIAALRAGDAPPGGPARDVLGRMLEMQADGRPGISDTWIHTNLLGLFVGMLPLTSKVSSLALDAMFSRRAAGRREGAAADGRDDVLWRCISEAMRFAAQTPGIFRVAGRDLTIGSGSGRSYTIPEGTRILAGTQPAMFDPAVFPQPGRVRLDRPDDGYFTLGYGLHACWAAPSASTSRCRRW